MISPKKYPVTYLCLIMSNHLLFCDKILGQINSKHFEVKTRKENIQIVLKKIMEKLPLLIKIIQSVDILNRKYIYI